MAYKWSDFKRNNPQLFPKRRPARPQTGPTPHRCPECGEPLRRVIDRRIVTLRCRCGFVEVEDVL